MIDAIVKNIGPELVSKLTGDFGLQPEQVAQTAETTKTSLKDGLTKELSKGNVDGLLSLFNQGSQAAGNDVFQNLFNNLVGDYVKKLGVSKEMANKVAGFVLPLIMDKIANKTGGNTGKADLVKIIGGEAGNLLKDKAGGLLKGGLGNLFK